MILHDNETGFIFSVISFRIFDIFYDLPYNFSQYFLVCKTLFETFRKILDISDGPPVC